MKILLINPPRDNEIIANNPSIIEEERGYSPPLGLLYIAAFIEKYTKHEISVIDAQVDKLDYSSLKEKIVYFLPDVVGITAMTMTMVDVVKTLHIIKGISSNIKVVLGGPHVNLFPNETIRLEGVDYLVLGEGEAVFADLINAIETGADLSRIPGLVFKDKAKIVNTGQSSLVNNLDEIPFPARHLVPYKKYTSLLAKRGVVTTMFTSRGCPFKCSFCDRPHLGKIFRARSAENVVNEIESCVNMGVKEFLFYDDTFTVNKTRVIDICNEIISRRLKIAWDIRARVDTVDEEMVKYLKKAGCRGIHYGIESGSGKILKILNKGITIEQAHRAFTLTRKYGILILAYFMIGNPNETRKDIHTTFKVIKELNPDYVHMTILTPFPGTKVYSNGLEKGVIKRDLWKEFAEDPSADFVPPHWDEHFSRNELNKLLCVGYRQFYLRPLYIINQLIKMKSINEFKKKARAGIKVFNMKTNRMRSEPEAQ